MDALLTIRRTHTEQFSLYLLEVDRWVVCFDGESKNKRIETPDRREYRVRADDTVALGDHDVHPRVEEIALRG